LEQAIGGLVQSLDPIALKWWWKHGPVPKPELKADLLGTCGSSGMAEGIARVVMRDEDLPTIQKGDILVAMSTSPAWTPVFSMISGVVWIEGQASHTLPSLEGSTAFLLGDECLHRHPGDQIGQRIRVDGNLGPFTSWINDKGLKN